MSQPEPENTPSKNLEHHRTFSFLRAAIIMFVFEVVLYVILQSPIPVFVREVISIPFIYVLPGCLMLLALRRKRIDLVRLALFGFVVSLTIGAGASLLLGAWFKSINPVVFSPILVGVAFVSLIVIWKRRIQPENVVVTDKYLTGSLVLCVAYFASLLLLYAYWSPLPVPDGARYFHAAQNYIQSFSFSPSPPFPLQSWEVGVAEIGGAISFRNLWIAMIALPSLAAQSASITVVRTLDIFLTSLLVPATFYLGSLVGDKKIGLLASVLMALNPVVVLFAPCEAPYVGGVLITLIAYTMYISAMGSHDRNFTVGLLSLSMMFMAFLLHIVAFFFAVPLVLHFMFVVLKYGNRRAKVSFGALLTAFSLLALRFFLTYSGSFAQFANTDLQVALRTVYNVFLIPIYFTAPIWILFIIGVVLTFAYKKHASGWGLNLYVTLISIPIFILIFVIFRYGVSFRFFLILFPLMSVIAAYGLLEDLKSHRKDIVFLSFLYFILILYLQSSYPNPWTVLFPFGRVTSAEVYLTFVPAIVLLAWKVAWKDRYRQHKPIVGRRLPSFRTVVVSVLIVIVIASQVGQVGVYVANPWLGVYVNPPESGLQEAADWINANVPASSVIVTNAWTYLGLYVDYTKTLIVPFPATEFELLNWVARGKVDYLVVLNSPEAPQEVTRLRSMYTYLMKYSDSDNPPSPPVGTMEEHRGVNFVVFKTLFGYGFSSLGVESHVDLSLGVWSLENGYAQVNVTRNALLYSYGQLANYIPVTQIDFENTVISVDGNPSTKLGMWDSVQWFNYTSDDWEEWTETLKPPGLNQYLQQIRTRLFWDKGNFTLFLYDTLERGKFAAQIQWKIVSLGNNTFTVLPSIRPSQQFNRAYVPSNQTTDWSGYTRDNGNPEVGTFGLGYLLSHTPDVSLSTNQSTAQSLQALVGKTTRGGTTMLTYTFTVTNEADTDRWALIEAYVPDSMIDRDGDGFYAAGLESFNPNDGRWWEFARWDAVDEGIDAAGIGSWANSIRATLQSGTRLSDALGYTSGYMQGVGLYELEGRDAIVSNVIAKSGSDAPANMTYSSFCGLKSRLGFAIRVPGRNGAASNKLDLRFYAVYDEATSITYEFSDSGEADYNYGLMNQPFIWVYDNLASKPSLGIILDRKPSKLAFTINSNYSYTDIRVVYTLPPNPDGQEFYTNLASTEDWPWYDTLPIPPNGVPDTFENTRGNTALFVALSSLAYPNFAFGNSGDAVTMSVIKSEIDNEYGVEPLYTVAVSQKWTVSGVPREVFLHSLMDSDTLIDVTNVSNVTFRIQPKAINYGSAIKEQLYDSSTATLKISLASGYVSKEMYGTLIIYMLRRVFIYTGDMEPISVNVGSEPRDWQYDDSSGLLKVTLTEVEDIDIEVGFATS